MDDTNNIGSVNVSITGDYSPLVDAFSQGKNLAQAAGKDIADSLAAGAAAGAQIGKQISDSLSDIAPAATAAANSLEQWTSAVEAAVAGGSTLAEAMTLANTAMEATVTQTQQAGEQLSLFGSELESIPFEEANGQFNLFATELETFSAGAAKGADDTRSLADSIREAGLEVDPVTGEIREFGQATKQAGESEAETTHETATLREQFLALGEALAVTEGLRRFGEAAIEVASEQQQLVISLTALTGSAEEAKQKLEQIEAFSFKNALAIDSVEAATQKMTAFGFEAGQIPKLLQGAADSARATGNSFESVADKIANIALSGVAGARQLTSLGLTAELVAKQMGVTADEFKKAFENLDQGQRIDALTGALGKFQGVSEAVAQSAAGQWQNLKNDFHNVLEEIGGALLPALTGLVGVLRDDIVPAVKDAAQWFTALPAPVKDVAIGVGLATAALAPLAAGLAAASLAMTGLQSLLPILTGLLDNLGLTAAKTAIEEEAAAAATTQLGSATATASSEIAGAEAATAGLAGAIGIGLVAALTAGIALWADWQRRMSDATQGTKELTAEFDKWLAKQVSSASTAQELDAAQEKINKALEAGVITAKDAAAALQTLTDKSKDLVGTDVADLLKGMGDSIHVLGMSAAAATPELKEISKEATASEVAYQKAKVAYDAVAQSFEKQIPLTKNHVATSQELAVALEKLNEAAGKLATPLDAVTVALANQSREAVKSQQAYTTALAIWNQAFAALKAGTGTYAEFAAAQDRLTAAEKAAAEAGVPIKGTLEAIDLAAKSATETMTVLASSHQIAVAAEKAHDDSLVQLRQSVITMGEKLALLADAERTTQKAFDDGRASREQLDTVQAALIKTSDELRGKQEALATATLRQGNAAADAAGQEGLLRQALDEANLALDTARARYEAGVISTGQYVSAQKAALSALMAWHDELVDTDQNQMRATDALTAASVAFGQAREKVQDLTEAYKNHLVPLKQVVDAQAAELNAQISLDEATARAATGLTTATDKTSIYAVQLAAAKARVDDLTLAVQSGLPVQDQLLSAQEALDSAQQKLNDTMGRGPAVLGALTSATKDHTGAVMGDTEACLAAVSVQQELFEMQQYGANAIEIATAAFQAQAAAAQQDASALKQTADSFIELSEGMNAVHQGINVGNGQKIYYNPADAPHYNDLFANAMSHVPTSDLAPRGTTISQSQLDELIRKLQVVADQLGGNDALSRVEDLYIKNGYKIPTLADFGVSASTASTPKQTGTAAGTSTVGASSTYLAGPSDASAYGGSYPGVVIHQAAGEMLLVALSSSGASGAGGYYQASGTAQSDSTTSALAAQSTALAVSTAADTISEVVGALQDLTGAVAQIVQEIPTVSKNVPGQPFTLPKASTTGSATAQASQTPTQSTNVTGTPTNVSVGAGGNGFYKTAEEIAAENAWNQAQQQWLYYGGPPPSTAPPSVPNPGPTSGGGTTINLQADFSGANFSGSDPAAVQDAVAAALNDSLTRMLRDEGARF